MTPSRVIEVFFIFSLSVKADLISTARYCIQMLEPAWLTDIFIYILDIVKSLILSIRGYLHPKHT